jgi:L-2-hydroxyglutarate oxidase LhgO
MQRCTDDGVSFMLESEVSELLVTNGRFHALIVDAELISAEFCVLAAGSHSTRLAAGVGVGSTATAAVVVGSLAHAARNAAAPIIITEAVFIPLSILC